MAQAELRLLVRQTCGAAVAQVMVTLTRRGPQDAGAAEEEDAHGRHPMVKAQKA